MKKTICFCLLLFAGSYASQAQEAELPNSKIKQYVQLGINMGALMPIGLPNTIREIESYNPGFNPVIGYELVYPLTDKWSVGGGVKFEYKGMSVEDSVLYFHTIITTGTGDDAAQFEGDYSGHNTTNVRNAYLTIPIHAVYSLSEKWRFELGVYAAFLINGTFDGDVTDGYIRKDDSLGEKIYIDEATFDFSEEQNEFDFGIQGSAHYALGERLGLAAGFSWGFIPNFPSDFKGLEYPLYNVFGNIGVEFMLF